MERKSTAAVRLVPLATLLAASFQVLSAQDFTVRMKDQDGKIAVHYVSRNGVRNVASNPVETDVIYRMDKGTIIRLNHHEKTYTETTLAQARQEMEKNANAKVRQQAVMQRLGINAANTSVTKIGPGENIAGYATEKYSIKTSISQGEVWVAPALDPPPGYYEMANSSAAAQLGSMGPIIKELREKHVSGSMLKMEVTAAMPMMKGISFIQVATSVDKSPISASTFEPPAGYRRVAAE